MVEAQQQQGMSRAGQGRAGAGLTKGNEVIDAVSAIHARFLQALRIQRDMLQSGMSMHSCAYNP